MVYCYDLLMLSSAGERGGWRERDSGGAMGQHGSGGSSAGPPPPPPPGPHHQGPRGAPFTHHPHHHGGPQYPPHPYPPHYMMHPPPPRHGQLRFKKFLKILEFFVVFLQVCGPRILLCMAPHLQGEVEIDLLMDLPPCPTDRDIPLTTILMRCHREYSYTWTENV
jgi:hypothetical protein